MTDLHLILVGVARDRGPVSSGSGAIGIRYVLPVLWMTLRFHIMGPTALLLLTSAACLLYTSPSPRDS